jgi:flavin reductase (DIM6/NTAB) family NADH-FMN oxidoreductase RutF
MMKKSLGSMALIYPAPVWCVGSYDVNGKPNVMTASWGGICCSKPPAVTISLRKATYTYTNLMATKAYTVSVPSDQFAREADYFGIASGKNIDKFEKTGLTAVKADTVNAPYVEEFPLVIECNVIHTHEIGLHTQFIGEIMDVKADQAILGEKELPEMAKLNPFVYAPESRTYYKVGEYMGKAFGIGKEMR